MTKDQKKDRLGRRVDQVRRLAKADNLNVFAVLESTTPSGVSINGHFSEPFVEVVMLSLINSFPSTCQRVFSELSNQANALRAQTTQTQTDDSVGSEPRTADASASGPLSVVS